PAGAAVRPRLSWHKRRAASRSRPPASSRRPGGFQGEYGKGMARRKCAGIFSFLSTLRSVSVTRRSGEDPPGRLLLPAGLEGSRVGLAPRPAEPVAAGL